MLAWETLALATGLLCLERRISYRRLRFLLNLDDEALEAVRHELIVGKRLAFDDDGEALVWVGDGASSPASSTPSTSAIPPAGAAAVRSANTLSATIQSGSSLVSAEAERRQLTVMFCDLVGSTALSTQMDPEDLRDVITSFQDKCREAIERYDGFIARYMGDGMLVYFGYPQAHENDAERAIRAGVDVVGAMAALNADIGTAHGIVLTVRVGIATGPVVVGDMIGEGAAEEAAVVGETPNLAARLQGVAQPDQVVISAATQRIVRDLFSVDDLGVHELKGIAQPTRAWRVSGVSDIEDRHESRRQTGTSPLMGRQEELGLLLRAWEASKEGHGQVVLIQGEPGVGKSRLLEALREPLVDEDYASVSVRCSPYHTSSTLYPVIEHFTRVLGWQPDDDEQVRLAKLEAALAMQSQSLEEVVPLYAELLSLPLPEGRYPSLAMTPQQQRDATLDAIMGWLLELAERTPVLQVWEDLHWADPTTLELLGLYIEQSPTVPMLSVLTYRPEFVPPWPTRSHMTPITLNRLERPEVEAFVGHLAGGKTLPLEVLERIVSKADGVPLYVEELTKTILESGLLQEDAYGYQLDGTLADLQIPSTLQDALMARLDRAPELRELAQVGAVLGREFAYDMLNAVTAMEEPVLQSGLQQLVEDELLYQRGRGQRSRYIFKHALIQDAAYQSLLKRTRRHYHRQVAEQLEARFSEIVETQPELVAHHFSEAGLTEQALVHWQRAGLRANQRSAYKEAMSHLTTGLMLLQTMPETQARHQQELRLQTALGAAALIARGHGSREVEAAYLRARQLCQQLGDTEDVFPVLFGLWRFYVARPDFSLCQQLAEELHGLAQRSDDTPLKVVADYAAGATCMWVGELGSARSHLEAGIARYTPEQRNHPIFQIGQDPGVACRAYDAKSLWLLGYPEQALASVHDSLARATEIAHPFSQAFALNIASIGFQLRREEKGVYAHADAGVALSTEQGFPHWAAFSTILRGWALASLGQQEEGLTQMRQGLSNWRATGAALFVPYFLGLMAETYSDLGQVRAGLDALEEGLEVMESTAEDWWKAELFRRTGALLLQNATPDTMEAENCFHQALVIARQQQARSFELRSAVSLARLWQQQGKQDKARGLLAPVYAWFSEGFDTADLKEAQLLLGELEAPEPDAAFRRVRGARRESAEGDG